MSEANDNYERRVDDLIAIVQQTIKDSDDFLKGRVKYEPHEYGKIKRDIMARQSMAMDALTKALAGQRATLDQLNRGVGLPNRRATDAPTESADIIDIKRRAGIE